MISGTCSLCKGSKQSYDEITVAGLKPLKIESLGFYPDSTDYTAKIISPERYFGFHTYRVKLNLS